MPARSYTEQASTIIYQNLISQARFALSAGHSVVLDGVYAREVERGAVKSLAEEYGILLEAIWLEGEQDVLKSRVASRTSDASDATPDVVDFQRRIDTGPIVWHRINASRSKADVLAEVKHVLGNAR